MMLVSVLGTFSLFCQELNCSVEINTSKVENANKQVFVTLQQAIADYLNTTKWTDAQFAVNEKIECKLFLVINSYEDPVINAELQLQSTRPVYNSSYTTTLINFKDNKFQFSYTENEPLVFSENTMESNLTAVLNFYAYLVLAFDFDTFGLLGGDAYYEKAANVVRMAQSSGESGWKAFEDLKNRSAVLSAFYEGQGRLMRELLYEYHRKGLDEMVLSPDKGRKVITDSLQKLKQVFDAQPLSVALSMFKDAKLDELVNIYSKSNSTERETVYETLYPLYPTETERLEKIRKEQK